MDLSGIDSCPGNLEGITGYLFLTLINSFITSKCSLGSKNSYNENYSTKLRNGDEFDFLVVGSGSGGSAVANKLSENPRWKVLVLEAGGYPSSTSDVPSIMYNLQDTIEDWQYKTEPSITSCLGIKEGRCRWPRGKVLGGSSSINVMLYVKGNKKDYDQWAELGNIGWDWNNVKEDFKIVDQIQQATRYLNGDPIEKAIQDAYKLKQFPVYFEENPENPIGSYVCRSTIKDGMRRNAAKAFLGQFKDRPNLFVATGAFVQKIVIDAKTKTATGVIVNIDGRSLQIKATKEVIVSGGSINSPQLLMLSGIGPKNHLKSIGIDTIKDLPVGENLQDHLVHFGLYATLSTDSVLPENRAENQLQQINQYFSHKKGRLSTTGLMHLFGFINTKNDSIYPNVQYHHALFSQGDSLNLDQFTKMIGYNDKTHAQLMDVSKPANVMVVGSTLLNPKSKGRILLKSNKISDPPLIYSGYFTDESDDDLNVMLQAIRFVEELIELPPIQKYKARIVQLDIPGCEKYKFGTDDYWTCSLRHLSSTIYHPIGTCKMGPADDGTSVVDPRLRVHGIGRLRVIDASIMPNVVSANTQLPVMMIGHKGGVMITEEWLTNHK